MLLAFGDHGMTDNGGHGGESINELRTVLFAYTKKGFPLKSHENAEVRKLFNSLAPNFK